MELNPFDNCDYGLSFSEFADEYAERIKLVNSALETCRIADSLGISTDQYSIGLNLMTVSGVRTFEARVAQAVYDWRPAKKAAEVVHAVKPAVMGLDVVAAL